MQDGDRDLSQQLLGLDTMLAQVSDKTVLDIGCAEALISRECARRGAHSVMGLEVVEANAAEGARQCAGLPVTVLHRNVEHFVDDFWNLAEAGALRFDLVLALAVLHKLKQPERAIQFIGRVCDERAVIRTAERTPGYVQDVRSKDRRIELVAPLAALGLHLVHHEPGPFNEWTGYFERR